MAKAPAPPAPLATQMVQTVIIKSVVEPDLLDSTAQYSTKDCAVHVINEDCIEVVFRIEGQELKRYKSRMSNGRNWAEYLWSMVLKRAIISHVY